MRKQVIKKAVVVFTVAIFISLAAGCFRTPAFADTKKISEYTLLAPILPIGNSTALEMFKTLDRMSSDFLKRTGIKIDVKSTNYNQLVETIIRDKPDFVYLQIDHIMELMKKDILYEPLVLLSVMKGKGAKFCIYAKGSGRKLTDLKGKTVSIASSSDFPPSFYMAARKLLFDNGFDMPPEKFFGGVIKLPGGNSSYQALLMGKTDGQIDINWSFLFYSQSIPQMKDINPVVCSEDYPTYGIFMRERIASADVEAFRKYMEGVHKNPVVGEMRTVLIAANAKFVAPDQELMKRFRDDFKESVRRGWYDESLEYKKRMDNMKLGQILKTEKSTYKECRKKCAAAKQKYACMDACMGG